MFELVSGQPPFDVAMLTPPILVQQMIGLASDELPSRWWAKWHAMRQNALPHDEEDMTLQEWLAEIYFRDGKKVEFTREEIVSIAGAITRMLKFEPSDRASAGEILALIESI